LLSGLAPDGGLYLPSRYPAVTARQLDSLRATRDGEGYGSLAAAILLLFADSYSPAVARSLADAAYTAAKFGQDQIVPVDRLGSGPLYLAHLSNGPTAAFKDLAMQLIAELFDHELRGSDSSMTVLGATSGDTGSAAEHALMGRTAIKVVMLTPRGRMTPFQRAQMFSIDDPSIANIAIDGVFDDCQDLVKAINLDAEFKRRWRIGAVNSINWARIVAQITYYFAAYFRSGLDRVSFAVPTGNFGNILAGHVAREMGLPIDRLILATNENNVLYEFFVTGVYRPRGSAETQATSSPSMDISKASNFERFVADLLGRDARLIADLFGSALRDRGFFDISRSQQFLGLEERYGFVAGSSTHDDRLRTIARVWQDHSVLVDPHTADAIHVASAVGVDGPIVVTEAALPIKFADTIRAAVGFDPPMPARFSDLLAAPLQVVDLPNDSAALKSYITRWLTDRESKI
jgi:threonine synthase